MEKERNLVGLSRDYIIHPGETLAEIIEDRGMTQRELAVRTGMTEKHISTVINGQKNISAAFARKLEYALGIETSFWMNLQANYDRELLEFEERKNVTEEEISVLKNLKEVSEVWSTLGWLDREANPIETVLDYRMIFGISNLLDTPKITYSAVYHGQNKHFNIDPYVLFAWQRTCELLTENVVITDEVDIEKLRTKIPEIKHTMFLRANQIPQRLSTVFSECGIAFRIVPSFTGAPVQGFIKKTEEGAMILCMTLKEKFADVFWFTLFHEIAHILNGDTKQEFIDFNFVSGDIETKADNMASEFLIDSIEYNSFVDSQRYKRMSNIRKFAASQNVKDYIIQGRLMKEEIIPWGIRPRYDWV